jgi:hypothetical protein
VPHDNIYYTEAIWVNVSGGVPEFPLGFAVEITFAAVVIYLWWRRRSKAKLPKAHFFSAN